jgi:putative protein-disulfide isomerase
MTHPHLIYFSDPMCSWCWGFSPVVEAIGARYGEALPIRLIMGGLRPGNAQPMSGKARSEIRGHWVKVSEASGQPFGESVVDRQGFVYDTDPVARAVVVARRAEPAMGLLYLRAAHRAFYVEGRDVTSLDVLADLADELGLDRAAFWAGLESEDAKAETWNDYNLSMNAGVAGFPTLIIGPKADGQYSMITRGFRNEEEVLAAIDRWLSIRAAA